MAEMEDPEAALNLAKLRANQIDYSELTVAQRQAVLSQRVTYDGAAELLCVSRDKLRELVRDGEIPVLQKPSGRQPALIEVSALQDYMDRLRSQANREAARRSKAAAAKRGQRGRGSAA